jgi:hypothetical protein
MFGVNPEYSIIELSSDAVDVCSPNVPVICRFDSGFGMYQAASFYRILSFNQPKGPWRLDRRQAFQDAQRLGLGSYDVDGTFYVTVPGDIQRLELDLDLIKEALRRAEAGERVEQVPAARRRRGDTIRLNGRPKAPGQQSRTAPRR